MSETVYASFADPSLAERAIGALMDFGVRAEDISLVARDDGASAATRDFAAHTATRDERLTSSVPVDAEDEWESGHVGTAERRDYESEFGNDDPIHRAEGSGKAGISTTTPADAAAGAAAGAAIGLGVGALAAIASILVPGVGLVAGGGALATAIAGAVGSTAAGAVAGGVHGYLKDQGVPSEAIPHYVGAYRSGGAIMGIHIPSNQVGRATVEDILAKYRANNIHIAA